MTIQIVHAFQTMSKIAITIEVKFSPETGSYRYTTSFSTEPYSEKIKKLNVFSYSVVLDHILSNEMLEFVSQADSDVVLHLNSLDLLEAYVDHLFNVKEEIKRKNISRWDEIKKEISFLDFGED